MLSVNLGKIELDHDEVDKKIRELIPFGINIREKVINGINVLFKKEFTYDWFEKSCQKRWNNKNEYFLKSIGTLGGGNHFIEFGKDPEENVWLTVHTGSRHLGKVTCEYWQKRAEKNIESKREILFKKEVKKVLDETLDKNEIQLKIKKLKDKFQLDNVSRELSYLEGEDMESYLQDMKFVQEFASLNREKIIEIIVNDILNKKILDKIETIHNYYCFEDNIIRKGAIRAYKGERCIIPFNMRDGILICEGKSNTDWNCSAPHGSGRVLSRSKAKKTLKVENYQYDMRGIFSTNLNETTIDESPEVYKDSELIELLIEPTVNVLFKIKPIHNMKGSEVQIWKQKQ